MIHNLINLGGILWYYGNAGHSEGTISFSGLKGVTYEQLEKMDLGPDRNRSSRCSGACSELHPPLHKDNRSYH